MVRPRSWLDLRNRDVHYQTLPPARPPVQEGRPEKP
jgi:hypothetical protein